MSQTAVYIPEKLFFKIGEVCELAGVQAHVLRYWESEFPMLVPQKNRAGQRVYRKRDVEMALRIKELLYEDQYTIAGARKRLANELRTGVGVKLRVLTAEGEGDPGAQLAFQDETSSTGTPLTEVAATGGGGEHGFPEVTGYRTAEERMALKRIASELIELLGLLEAEQKNSRK